MNKGLEELKRMAYENACCRCQYYISNKCTNKGECVWKTIERELKDYQEIKEIAKRYNWDAITSEIFNVKTDRKYRDLFDSAIVSIQKDYRKARALEIIGKKRVQVGDLLYCSCLESYNKGRDVTYQLTQKEYDLLKEVL